MPFMIRIFSQDLGKMFVFRRIGTLLAMRPSPIDGADPDGAVIQPEAASAQPPGPASELGAGGPDFRAQLVFPAS